MTRSSQSFEIEIEKIIYGGSGLGRHRGKVVFVPFAAPGDRLRVRTVLEKKTYIRAEIVEILHAGPGRTVPECPHFGSCGGCQWQHLEYARQVEAKRQILEEIFHHRLPQSREIPISMRACPEPYAYRSRARIQLRGSGAGTITGFYRSGSHRVEAVEVCPLLRPPLNRVLASLKQSRADNAPHSEVREYDIAASCEEGLWAAAPVENMDKETAAPTQPDKNSRNKEVLLTRKVGNYRYKVSAPVFFQANDFMISELVQLVLELAEERDRNAALDLYAGVGLFSLPLANLFNSVIAIENSPDASRLCADNATAAGFPHLQNVCKDVLQWMESATSEKLPEFDLIVLDPPRSGAGARVMERIRLFSPRTILYVSCDPQTLGRDLSGIPEKDYVIDRIEGLDMFPQTYHFETVVRLVCR